jgi:hypothetical protein
MKDLSRVKFFELDPPPELDMSSYLLDIICANNEFIGMGWCWTHTKYPMQIYCSVLWNHKYINI